MVQIVDAFAMFGRKPHRVAQTQRIGLQRAGIACLAFGFVHADDDAGILLAQDFGKDLIGGGDTDPAVDQEQTDIGHVDRTFGQTAHPALKAVVGDIFQPCRVDHGKAQIENPGVAFAQVAGDAGLVIDQRHLAPDKAVEQGGFADVGTSDNGQGKAHHALRGLVRQSGRWPYTQRRLTESVKLSFAADDKDCTARRNGGGSSAARNLKRTHKSAIRRAEETQQPVGRGDDNPPSRK